jgi:hypothetical protein
LTASFSILIGVREREGAMRDALLRSRVAEQVMERALATPFEELRSTSVSLSPAEVEHRSGWRAEVHVRPLGRSLKSVEVILSGGGRKTRLTTLCAEARGRAQVQTQVQR